MSQIHWLTIVSILTFLILIYRHLTRNFNYWKDRDVPYIKPVPIFGNILKVVTLQQSLGQFVKEIYDSKDAKFIGYFVFDQPFLLIRNLDLIKHILIRDFDHFHNRSVVENRRDDVLGSNLLFVIKNPAWRTIRTKLTPAFSTGKIKSMLHLMVEASEDLREYVKESVLSSDGEIESREMSMKYTTDVISSCVFGINAQSLRNQDAEFRVEARRLFTWSINRSVQMASYFIAPCLVKLFGMKFMEPQASNFMGTVFLNHMQHRKNSKTKRGDLIDILLQMEEDQDYNLDAEVLVAQALQFFIAGFETTGNTITFALYELAVNETVQIRLRNEIIKVLDAHKEISYEAIMDMKYLDNVICETLRKYPALTFLDRRCSKPYKIPNSNVTIEKDIPVYISLFGLHMDEKYFPEPHAFKPDRFSNENKSSIPPFAYLPFGEGPRNCIGARFGLLSAKTALIAILSEFEVELHPSTSVPLKLDAKSGFLIAPEGGILNLRFRRCT